MKPTDGNAMLRTQVFEYVAEHTQSLKYDVEVERMLDPCFDEIELRVKNGTQKDLICVGTIAGYYEAPDRVRRHRTLSFRVTERRDGFRDDAHRASRVMQAVFDELIRHQREDDDPCPDCPPHNQTLRSPASHDSAPMFTPAPIPMLIICPRCHMQHIDDGAFSHEPHSTHACQGCGLLWKPALVPTVGVQFLPGCKNEVK